MIPADTTPDAFLRQAHWFRRLTGPERLELMLRMCDDARELAASGVRRRRPELDGAGVVREVTRLFNEVAPDLG